MSIRMEVWGENACFTRPEMKTERVTYDVMTPSAARGILEAVYWHPGMRWHIDKIEGAVTECSDCNEWRAERFVSQYI